MPILGALTDFTPGTLIQSSAVEADFETIRTWVNTYPVLTDTARTITVAHTFSHASGLLTDTITERTAAAGVTIDGTLLKDGGATLTAALTLPTAGILFAGDTTIKASTSDGSDNASLVLAGGGAASVGRGAYISIAGNENAAVGQLYLSAGNAGGSVDLAGAGLNMRVKYAGGVLVGTTDDTSLGTTDLRLAGALWIGDGITAPTARAGFAAIYVDAADGDLKIKFGDGFVGLIAADS